MVFWLVIPQERWGQVQRVCQMIHEFLIGPKVAAVVAGWQAASVECVSWISSDTSFGTGKLTMGFHSSLRAVKHPFGLPPPMLLVLCSLLVRLAWCMAKFARMTENVHMGKPKWATQNTNTNAYTAKQQSHKRLNASQLVVLFYSPPILLSSYPLCHAPF